MIPPKDIRVPAIERWHGGRTVMIGSAIVGVVCCAAALLGLLTNVHEAALSWLFGFDFWMSISIGALLMLTSFQASRARWPVALRRPLEAMSATALVLPFLFLPVIFLVKVLFPWAGDPHGRFTPHELQLLHHKAPYLNVPFWVGRAVLFLVLWAAVAWLLFRWSRRQDQSGELHLTRWQWWLGAGATPLVGLALSFATLDWMMSLEPLWYSTVYGAYVFAGGFLAALAVASLIAAWGQHTGLFAGLLRPAHFHSLGKLILAFTAFWAYMAFSQYMLIWIADLPEEARWYIKRVDGIWGYFAGFLALGRFLLPFFVLLSKQVKVAPRGLTVVALWTIFAHLVDVYWLIFPAVHEAQPVFHWTQPLALIGMGGILVAFTLWRLRGEYPMPVRDPYLYVSLNYEPK